MDLSVRPQDDFFRYVNGTWADKTPIPADLASYGAFATLRDRAQEAVREIVEAEANGSPAPGSNGQKIGSFYKSFMNESRIESLGVQPLAAELDAIDRIASVNEPRQQSMPSPKRIRFIVGLSRVLGPDSSRRAGWTRSRNGTGYAGELLQAES